MPIAVLMCMTSDTPSRLVERALSSTAQSLEPDDVFFLLIDGGGFACEAELRAASAPVPLRLFSSPERKGLAAGLNRLIDAALSEPDWDFLARMDADDVSLPARMSAQRDYLENNPAIAILGTGCREVDEAGVLLQIKSMPVTHGQIIASLPRRNPMNHPTVMFRRRVFEEGLRYREGVGLIEDYFLWVDAAAAGFHFANLREPFLDFRRDRHFFKRRGGWRQAKADFCARCHAMRCLNRRSPANFLWAIAALGLRCLPASAQEFLYRRLR